MSRIIHGDSHKSIKYFRENPAALAVLMIYIGRANPEGVAWPSLDGLAHDTGWTKTPCLNARHFLVEHGVLEAVPDYVRPAWRDKPAAELARLRNLDHSEYYRVTGVFIQGGKFYPLLYMPEGQESDVSDEAPIVHAVDRRSGRPSSASTVEPVDGRPDGPELDSTTTELDSNKAELSSITTQLDSTTTNGSTESACARADDPLADVVVDVLIKPEVEKLCLLPETQAALLAHGPAYALAVAWVARDPRIKNPAGFARSLMEKGGPPEQLLKAAEIAIGLGITDRQAAERALSLREYEQLQADAHRIVEEQMPDPSSGEPESKSAPVAELTPGESPADSLNDQPPGTSLTIREIWHAVMGSMSLGLGSQATVLYRGTLAKHYADGVLTVQAPSPMARDMINRHCRTWGHEATKIAGVPVEVRAV